MKQTISVLAVLIVLSGCNKKPGVIDYSITYEATSSAGIKSADPRTATVLHTGLGDYITSVTPDKLTAKFQTIRFYDGKLMEKGGHICELIDNNAPEDDISRYADFTGNATLEIVPVLWGMKDNYGNFMDREIEFIYFTFWGPDFYQEVDLPSQYNGVDLMQFNRGYNNRTYTSQEVKPEARLTVDCYPLIYSIFREEDGGFPFRYIFGNTSVTKVVYPLNEEVSSLLAPLGTPGINPFVWSEKFDGFTLVSPESGETLEINITLGFNITELIQIYAGADNIPYTSDDLLVYAPNFWERLSAEVTIN